MIAENPKLIKPALYIFFISLILQGCATLKVDKISYNDEAQVYEYPAGGNESVVLRNGAGELVTDENYQEFLIDLAKINFHYLIDEQTERAELLRNSDLEIAEIYSQTLKDLNNQDYTEATKRIDTLRLVYPKLPLYSDILFLEGYAFEKRGEAVQAILRYDEYLRFSSGKYSERFRGYKYADKNDSLWIAERDYARNYLAGNQPKAENSIFTPIIPKYYFNSLQPGYTLNEETLHENKNGNIYLTLGTGFSSDLSLGIQYYKNLTRHIDINPGYFTSGDVSEVSLAIPVQVYRSPNNKTGLKFSPFVRYSNITKLHVDDYNLEMDEQVFNMGFKVSAGYYLFQNFSLGAYYTYNYYNVNRPYGVESKQIDIWWNNEYDVSLYYNILKGFSLKAGVKANDIVAGIYWEGWEISYDFNQQKIILRADLY